MKTHTIKTPTAELLVVELPDGWVFNTYKDQIGFCNEINKPITQIKGSYTLLGRPDEIREEDARELVHKNELGYTNYNAKTASQAVFSKFPTAKESLLSLLESEIFWENPFDIPSSDDINWYRNQITGDFSERYTYVFNWHEAEQKTFDRNRTIILKTISNES